MIWEVTVNAALLFSAIIHGTLSTECPDDWQLALPGFCVRLFLAPLSWYSASDVCSAETAHLVMPKSAEQNLVVQQLAANSQQRVWIGLRDVDEEGVWRWLDGQVVAWTGWGEGRPDNYGGNEDCAAVFPNDWRQWDDLNCFEKQLAYVCQKPVNDSDIVDIKLKNYRLPDNLVPVHYDLRIHPFDFDFKGSVNISVECLKTSDMITLHVDGVSVNETSVSVRRLTGSGSQPNVVAIEYDQSRNFAILRLDRNLVAKHMYVVQMAFTGTIKSREQTGLYNSSYTSSNGQVKHVLSTQFEPTRARQVFPCMDEPGLKATFNVTLVRPQHMTSLSNMPLLDQSEPWVEENMAWVADTFQKTPKMSTYLLAFAISDYEHKEKTSKYNITHGIWAPADKMDQTDFALNASVAVLDFFQDNFGVSFPMPKLDNFGVPEKGGAMENWGLVTYDYIVLYYSPTENTAAEKELVLKIVGHELAHQWFGNLVTMSWWDDIWLNEGFVTYMSYFVMDHLKPQWKVFDRFSLQVTQDAFDADDDPRKSVPVVFDVGNPSNAFQNSRIIYSKGAAIIRMMKQFLGYGTFKAGIVEYLKTNSFGSVNHKDLFNALMSEAGVRSQNLDLKGIMFTWLKQKGYPVVSVSRDVGNSALLVVKQEPSFQISSVGHDEYQSESRYRWTIPLTFATRNAPDFNERQAEVHWMHHTQHTMKIDLGPSMTSENTSEWFVANVGEVGYYRVKYDQSNWEALARQLTDDHRVISSVNRAQIIRDAWWWFKKGHLDLNTALLTLDYFGKEREYAPIKAGLNSLNDLQSSVAFTDIKDNVKLFIKEKLREIYNDFDMTNEGSHTDALVRSTIFKEACEYGVEECLVDSSEAFTHLMTNTGSDYIDHSLIDIVVCNALKNSSAERLQFALDMYQGITSESRKFEFLVHTLTCSPSDEIDMLINSTLNNLMHTGDMLCFYLLYRVWDNNNFGLVARFLQENIEELVTTFPKYVDYIKEFLKQATNKNDNMTSSNQEWLEEHKPELESFLRERGFMQQ